MKSIFSVFISLVALCFFGCMKEQVSVDLFPVRDAMLSLERGQGELHEFNQKMIHKILFSAFVLRTYTDAEGLVELQTSFFMGN